MGNQILTDIKRDNATAEDWLINYPERRMKYLEDFEIRFDKKTYCEVPTRSGPGRPTEVMLPRLDRLMETEKWLVTIEKVQDTIGPKKKAFLYLRREAKHMDHWRPYVREQYAILMADRLNGAPHNFMLGLDTISDWWHEIIELTVRLALMRGCNFRRRKES